MIKGYIVTYQFKTEDEYEYFQNNDPEDLPLFKWLSDSGIKVYTIEESNDDREHFSECLEFSFRLKKDASKFARQFKLEVSGPHNIKPFNPWMPDGCESFDDCYEIYGAVPGDR